jgi:hypothetical protein
MSLNLQNSTAASGKNITSALLLASYAASADRMIAVSGLIKALNAAAAVLTLELRQYDGTTEYRSLDAFSASKQSTSDTVQRFSFNPVKVRSGWTIRLYATSTNSSDTSTGYDIDFDDTGSNPASGDAYAYVVTNLGALGAAATALAPASTALSTAVWTGTIAGRIDAAVTSRMATYTQPTGFLAATFPSTVSSYAGADTSGTTTLLTRIPSAITVSGGKVAATMGSGDYTGNTVQTGDSFARIGATGSGLTSLAPASTALSTAVWTGTIAGRIDAAISSRMASGSVTLAASQPDVVFASLICTGALRITGGVAITDDNNIGADTVLISSHGNGADTVAIINPGGGGSFCINVNNDAGLALELSNNSGPTAVQVFGDGSQPAITVTALNFGELAASQPNYAPAKAGDAMTLTSGERSAIDSELSGTHGSGQWGGGGASLRTGTARAGSAYSITLDAGANSANGFYPRGTIIILTGGTGAGQWSTLTGYDGTTKIATVERDWIVSPDNASVFELLAGSSRPR